MTKDNTLMLRYRKGKWRLAVARRLRPNVHSAESVCLLAAGALVVLERKDFELGRVSLATGYDKKAFAALLDFRRRNCMVSQGSTSNMLAFWGCGVCPVRCCRATDGVTGKAWRPVKDGEKPSS